MQIPPTSHKKPSSLINLTNLLGQSSYNSSSASTSSPSLPHKAASLSQSNSRVSSQDSLSSREDDESFVMSESEFSIGAELEVQKSYSEPNENSSSFQQKSNDEVRRGYINRLVNLKILDLQPKKKNQNLTIFDWDDTLFCTSFLGNKPFHKICENTKNVIKALDSTTSRIIHRASKISDVYIITNSDPKWVEQSSQSLLPKTYELIARKKVKIISARKEYQALYPEDLYRWKLEAFLSLKKEYQHDAVTNMVVLGDSEFEMRAGKALGMQFKQAFVKTVKFDESPKIEELIKQHRVVLNLFDEIFLGHKNLSIRLGKSQEQL